MLSSVFCSRMSCGCICIWKRRAISNRRSSTMPNEISLQRLVEDRLADRAHRGFELVDARAGRHPAGLDVQLGDAAVVAIEEREEILGEIVLVARVERADDAEVDRRVARVLRIARRRTKMLPGCMSAWKKLCRNTCVKKISTPFSASRWMSVPSSRSSRDVADQHAVDALHHHHVAGGRGPSTPRARTAAREPAKLRLQLRGVRRLAHQVELVEDRLLVLAHDLARPQAARVRPVVRARSRASACSTSRSRSITSRMPGRSTLTTTSRPSVQRRGVHLGDRRRGQRRLVEAREELGDRPAVGDASMHAPARRRRGTAARGPAASRARRRCRAAAGRGASRAPGRT